ncbi:hypothetical protein HU262_10710 [Enterococcus hirae]|uniref:hypothetical protein n=1 Tax=Enterococcus hirae TaxID=1354 RepID=UPI0006B21BDE|nr:hypothetical protein [Enterococcus hirae]QKX67172.1 hypothetical protein HU262_10710 [Enterococcus hirae]
MKVNEALEMLENMPAEAMLYFWVISNGKQCLMTPTGFKLNPDGDGVGIESDIVIAIYAEETE